MVELMEADYGDKLVVSLLRLELLSAGEHIDEAEYYRGQFSAILRLKLIKTVLSRMIRTIVLNETNFKTLLHHVHMLKDLRYDF